MNDQNLDVILRTHSLGSVISSNRIVSDQLAELKLKSIVSLFHACDSAKCAGLNITLTILDDHSADDFLTRIKTYAEKIKLSIDLIHLEDSGYNNSAYQQYLKASESKNLVYIVEDDYFHSFDAIKEMWSAYHYFKNFVPFGEIGIFPFDCPDRYNFHREQIAPCRLFFGNGRYWKTITHTTITSLYHGDTVRNYFDVFKTLALEYPKVDESNTINLLYNNLVYHGGPITMFSPIPSLAIHVSYEQPIALITDMNEWKSLWSAFGDLYDY